MSDKNFTDSFVRTPYDSLLRLLSHDIGVDLGTTNTLVYVKGKGIVINEPTVVALNNKTGQMLNIGKQARDMIGRTPQHIRAVKPLTHGVISEYDVAEELLRYLVSKAQRQAGIKLIAPRIVIGAPSGITNVERRAIRKAAKNAGARVVHVIEEPMLAAIGVKAPVHDPIGTMVVDMGGGTTDIAVISLGGIVTSKHTTMAGERLTSDIQNYIREEFQLNIGEKTADDLKKMIANLDEDAEPRSQTVKGRDVVRGLPTEIAVSDADIREAIMDTINLLIRDIKLTLESVEPEIVADIYRKGITLVGGGALLKGLPGLLKRELGVDVAVPNNPLHSVVHGASIVLDQIRDYEEAFVHDDEIPITSS